MAPDCVELPGSADSAGSSKAYRVEVTGFERTYLGDDGYRIHKGEYVESTEVRVRECIRHAHPFGREATSALIDYARSVCEMPDVG